MEHDSDAESWLRLIHAPDSGLRKLNRLVERHWSGRSLAELSAAEVATFLRLASAALPAPERGAIVAGLRWLARDARHRLLPITDPRYPWLLSQLPDAPPALYVLGDPQYLNRPCLAIVGSRLATPQGRETARRMGRQLAGMGFTVVSGLARGIDGCAHRGALETGATVAVCAHGLDSVYPPAHRELAAAITGQGALVSAFPIGRGPQRRQFPSRNRLISGMSLGTLVVEAGLSSGSLITARLAAEQNREVFAVPGPISAPQSRGCHALIRQGAVLVESVNDLLAEFGQYTAPADDTHAPPAMGDGEQRGFLRHMGHAPCTRDELVARSGLTPAEVSSMLLRLELEGFVELCPGGTYARVTRS